MTDWLLSQWIEIVFCPLVIDDPVDLVPLFRFDHNMQQVGTDAIQYIVVFCYSLILNQQSHRGKAEQSFLENSITHSQIVHELIFYFEEIQYIAVNDRS